MGNIGTKNRIKGEKAEKFYASVFRENGFPLAQAGKFDLEGDNLGIDITNMPINFQVKSGYPKGINYSNILYKLKQKITATRYERRPCAVIHRKHTTKHRNEFCDLVVMTFSDYLALFNKAYNENTNRENILE